MAGEKKDEGKLRYDLIPAYPLQELARVYTIGSEKYGDNNWRDGIAYSRVIGALMRHLEAWRMGRSVDPDDGQHPLASVAWCVFTLMEYENTHPEFDDRPGLTLPLAEVFKRHLEHEFKTIFAPYIPGKPCPKCGYTCIMPKEHSRRCCECHPEDYPSMRKY